MQPQEICAASDREHLVDSLASQLEAPNVSGRWRQSDFWFN
jgi:hypothetical protein